MRSMRGRLLLFIYELPLAFYWRSCAAVRELDFDVNLRAALR